MVAKTKTFVNLVVKKIIRALPVAVIEIVVNVDVVLVVHEKADVVARGHEVETGGKKKYL